MWIIILFQLLIILVLVFYIHDLIAFEQFVGGYGTTFGRFYNPIPPCTNETNCFKGFTSRDTTYTNICEPRSVEIPCMGPNPGLITGSWASRYNDKLLTTKRPLKEECIRIY